MKLRTATPEDCPAIARVHVAGWRTTYRGIVADEILDQLSHAEMSAKWLEKLDRSQVILVAEDERQGLVGFADGGPERTGRTDYRGELYAIYLLECCRRQGIGRQLVTGVFESLLKAGLDSALIWVLAENPCRAFYDAIGGRPIDRREIKIGDRQLVEVAYGWNHVSFAKFLSSARNGMTG